MLRLPNPKAVSAGGLSREEIGVTRTVRNSMEHGRRVADVFRALRVGDRQIGIPEQNRPDAALVHEIGGKRKIEALVLGASVRRVDCINLLSPRMRHGIDTGLRDIDVDSQRVNGNCWPSIGVSVAKATSTSDIGCASMPAPVVMMASAEAQNPSAPKPINPGPPVHWPTSQASSEAGPDRR